MATALSLTSTSLGTLSGAGDTFATLTPTTDTPGSLSLGRLASAIMGSSYHIMGEIVMGDTVALDNWKYLALTSTTRGTLT